MAQVLAQVLVDIVGGGGAAAVQDTQALPVQAADAAAGVAPGDAGAEDQLVRGVGVSAAVVDVGADLLQARRQRHWLVGMFSVVKAHELFGLVPVGRRVCRRRAGCGWPGGERGQGLG
ncbi:hypothetical protein GCM10010469_01460 [Streptomyces labedae]|uniref:Uncharacterized protein n=1 Tax=Streptomyces labedae TaxID=285569 RepID=A0ABP6QPY6_9ACTN